MIDLKEILNKNISIELNVDENFPDGTIEVSDVNDETISEEDFATLLKNAESIGLITDDDYGSIQFADCCGYHFAAIFYKKE